MRSSEAQPGRDTHRYSLRHDAFLAGDRKHVAYGSCRRPNLGAASALAASERGDARSGVTSGLRALTGTLPLIPACTRLLMSSSSAVNAVIILDSRPGVSSLCAVRVVRQWDTHNAKANARGAWAVHARTAHGSTRSVRGGDATERLFAAAYLRRLIRVPDGSHCRSTAAACAPRR